jgi:hypothetical protein
MNENSEYSASPITLTIGLASSGSDIEFNADSQLKNFIENKKGKKLKPDL